MSFGPCNHPLKIRLPIPKVGAQLGVCGFIPSHSPTLLRAWNVIPRLHSWTIPLQTFALVTNLGRVAIIFLSKLTKRDKKKEKGILFMWNKKVDEVHMKTKCPKQLWHLFKKEDHQYVPCLELKPHAKNVLQSFENPLIDPKCVNYL
jgi:hypothetical protein